MNGLDVCTQLAKIIPTATDGFSNSLAITSIVPTANIALVTTPSPHGLSDGAIVSIIGAQAPVQIDTGTFLRTLTTATFKTLQDQDLTLSERDKSFGGKTIDISGANESEFNGTFQLLKVVNRRELIIAVADSGSTTISGSPIVDNANGGIFNGVFPIFNATASTFEYTLPISYPLPAEVTNAKVQISIRIASVLDITQYISEVYTKRALTKDQLIVQLGDVTQSKNRNEESDADDSSTGQYSYTPTLIQPFAIYILQNVTDQVSASLARDKVENEYVPAIFKAVMLAKFDTGFTYSQHRATFVSHGVFAYSEETQGERKALYAHEVAFQQLANLDKDKDTAGADDTVAMRDVDYTLTTDLGTGELLANVDLDEEIIP